MRQGKGGGEQRVKPRSPRKGGGGGKKHPSRESGESQWLNLAPVAKFHNGFILHSGLKIEREISHTFEIRNFPQRNIPPAKSPPPVLGLQHGLPNQPNSYHSHNNLV